LYVLKLGVSKSPAIHHVNRENTPLLPPRKKRGRERECFFAKNSPFTIRLHPTLRDPLTLNAPSPAIVAQLRFKRQSYFPAVPRSKDGQPQHPTGWISEDKAIRMSLYMFNVKTHIVGADMIWMKRYGLNERKYGYDMRCS